jgi:hypothetical protein
MQCLTLCATSTPPSDADLSITELDQPRAIAFRLVRLAWGCTFMNYFWLKKQREMQGKEPTGS